MHSAIPPTRAHVHLLQRINQGVACMHCVELCLQSMEHFCVLVLSALPHITIITM